MIKGNIKKIFVLLLVLFVCFAFCSCGSKINSAKDFKERIELNSKIKTQIINYDKEDGNYDVIKEQAITYSPKYSIVYYKAKDKDAAVNIYKDSISSDEKFMKDSKTKVILDEDWRKITTVENKYKHCIISINKDTVVTTEATLKYKDKIIKLLTDIGYY